MRILHVITSLRTGGAEKLMVDLLPRLRDKGHEVELCVFDGTRTPFMDRLEEQGIKMHKLTKSMYSPVNVIKLLPLMSRFDYVHTHNSPCQFAAAILGMFNNAKLITTEHSTNNRRRGKWYWRLLDKWMYNKYNRVVCISDKTECNLRKWLEISQGRLVTIYNGINVNEFNDAEQIDRLSVGSSNSNKVITMVSAFRYQKDHDTIINAMTLLPEDYELWLVGDGERRHIIERLIKQTNLTNRVRLLGVRSDTPQILNASDVVVQSSHIDGFCLAAVEGMAAGKPLIASEIDGLAQVVGGAGILCEHANPKAFADAIRHLCEDKEYAQQVAAACQERAKQYDISLMAERYAEIYE